MVVFMSMLVSHVSLRFIISTIVFSYACAFVPSENQAVHVDIMAFKNLSEIKTLAFHAGEILNIAK